MQLSKWTMCFIYAWMMRIPASLVSNSFTISFTYGSGATYHGHRLPAGFTSTFGKSGICYSTGDYVYTVALTSATTVMCRAIIVTVTVKSTAAITEI